MRIHLAKASLRKRGLCFAHSNGNEHLTLVFVAVYVRVPIRNEVLLQTHLAILFLRFFTLLLGYKLRVMFLNVFSSIRRTMNSSTRIAARVRTPIVPRAWLATVLRGAFLLLRGVFLLSLTRFFCVPVL